jgi:peptide/nickel transport system ATP-binding protein
MNELLSINELTVRFHTYDGVITAVNNVCLSIGQSETYGLVGETGCGKTVTALSILRLVLPPGIIEHGSIYFRNDNSEVSDLLSMDEDEIRSLRGSKISMIFQEPSSALNPVYTIGDQISESILLHCQSELVERILNDIDKPLNKVSLLTRAIAPLTRFAEKIIYKTMSRNPHTHLPRIIRRIPIVRKLLWRTNRESLIMATDLLRDVEIPDSDRVVCRYPHELSGGMKQRSVIAMSLACNPKLLIADEPTTALDVTIQAQILDLIQKLKREHNASILYITHDLGVAAEICDRIGVMYVGHICEEAGVEDLYSTPLHPYTQALMAAVPKLGQQPQPIPGILPDLLNPPKGCGFHPRCSKSMGICLEKVPVMQEVSPGHNVACHLY